MRLNSGVTLEMVRDNLMQALSSHIAIKIVNNSLVKNSRWIEVNKEAFVGVRIFLKDEHILIAEHTPSFFAKVLSGGIVNEAIHRGARREFKNQITSYLIREFYTQ